MGVGCLCSPQSFGFSAKSQQSQGVFFSNLFPTKSKSVSRLSLMSMSRASGLLNQLKPEWVTLHRRFCLVNMYFLGNQRLTKEVGKCKPLKILLKYLLKGVWMLRVYTKGLLECPFVLRCFEICRSWANFSAQRAAPS